MPLVFTADSHLTDQQARLLNANRAVVSAGVEDLEGTPYDHVVRTLADLPAPSGGIITLTSGSWVFAAAVDLGTDYIDVPPATDVFLTGLGWNSVLSGSASWVIRVRGTLLGENLAVDGVINHAIALAGGDAYLSMCELTAAAAAIRVNGASGALQVIGGQWASVDGLAIAANMNSIQLSDIAAVCTTFVNYSGGSIRACLIGGCEVDCATGINWASGSLPFEGLAVDGNHIDYSVAAYNGHTPASARVNYKANTCNLVGALLTETAIVP